MSAITNHEVAISTLVLPAHWACALINDDESGLDDDDTEAVSKFMEAVEPGWCVGCSDAPFFAWTHDAIDFAKAGDCLEFQFQTIWSSNH